MAAPVFPTSDTYTLVGTVIATVPGPGGTPGAPGAAGTNGVSAFTTTTADFTQPAVSATVAVSLAQSAFLVAGMDVYVQNGGYYNVFNVPNGTSATLTNLGYTGNALAGVVIPSTSKVIPAGIKGTDGATVTNVAVYYSVADPNGSQSAIRPAICYGTGAVEGSVWIKTNAGLDTAGWTQIIAGP